MKRAGRAWSSRPPCWRSPWAAPTRAPEFAYEACEQLTEGADCTVEFHEHTLSGSCLTDADNQLFCMPDELPPPPEGRPPAGPSLM